MGIVYVLARAANDVHEFQYRMRGETVVEHDVVHPSVSILTEDELFSFCYFEYAEDFAAFAAAAPERIAQAPRGQAAIIPRSGHPGARPAPLVERQTQ